MLVKLSCVAIVLAIACFQTGYSASLKHETEETKTSEIDETSELKDRSKRALYYQNDLISNQERQLRSLLPAGGAYPFYDYAYPIYPFYDYLYPDIYDQLLAQYALEDYYYYGFPVMLSGKQEKQKKHKAAGAHHPDATQTLSGRRGDSRTQPLSGMRAPQGAPYMPSQNFQQHQTFGSHAPHHFSAPAAPAPPSMLAPPAPYMQPLDDSNMQAYQQQRYHDQFEAIKHAAQSGNRRNY